MCNGREVHYVFDPTGWAIQLDVNFSRTMTDCQWRDWDADLEPDFSCWGGDCAPLRDSSSATAAAAASAWYRAATTNATAAVGDGGATAAAEAAARRSDAVGAPSPVGAAALIARSAPRGDAAEPLRARLRAVVDGTSTQAGVLGVVVLTVVVLGAARRRRRMSAAEPSSFLWRGARDVAYERI